MSAVLLKPAFDKLISDRVDLVKCPAAADPLFDPDWVDWGTVLGTVPDTPWYRSSAIEHEAYLNMTVPDDTWMDSDWGNPGKQHEQTTYLD